MRTQQEVLERIKELRVQHRAAHEQYYVLKHQHPDNIDAINAIGEEMTALSASIRNLEWSLTGTAVAYSPYEG